MAAITTHIRHIFLFLWSIAIALLLTQGNVSTAYTGGDDADDVAAAGISQNHRADDHFTDCSQLVHKVKWRTKIQHARCAILPDVLDFPPQTFFSAGDFHHTAQVIFFPPQFSFRHRGPPLC